MNDELEAGCAVGAADAPAGGEATALVGSIQKFSVEDGPGIRTTVFLKGCPLRCRWCHNPELISFAQELIASPGNCIGCGSCIAACPESAISPAPGGGIVLDRDRCRVCLACARTCTARALRPVAAEMTASEVLRVAEQDKGFYDHTGGGITLSGGELLSHVPFARALVAGAAERGMDVCLDTCGFGRTDDLLELARAGNVTDVLFDVKAVDDGLHRACTSVGSEPILSNLRALMADPVAAPKVWARMPLVAGLNDGEQAIEQAGALYRDVGVRRVSLLAYHDFGVAKMRNVGGKQERFEPPSEERLERIKARFEADGLEVDILGKA